MKPLYQFEKELIDKYDLEPANEGYNIDDLKDKDRQKLSGMLWVLYTTIEAWRTECEDENEACGETIGKILNEHTDRMYDLLIKTLLMDINDFVVATLEEYEEEGGK